MEISAPVAGVTIKDAFSIVSEVKDDTFQVRVCEGGVGGRAGGRGERERER